MLESSNMKFALCKVKAHVGIEGKWWADEFAKIGCQGKGKDVELKLPEPRMNMTARVLLVELDSIVPGKGIRWLGKMRKEVANDIRVLVKLCSESEGAGGSLPIRREPKATIF